MDLSITLVPEAFFYYHHYLFGSLRREAPSREKRKPLVKIVENLTSAALSCSLVCTSLSSRHLGCFWLGLSFEQLPVECSKSVLTQRKQRVSQTWQPQFGLQDIIRDGPHKWFRSLTEVPQARETSCAEEYQRTREKIGE